MYNTPQMKSFNNIFQLSTRISQVYLIKEQLGAILIDSGHRFERAHIIRQLKELLGKHFYRQIKALFLTHAHPDHDGNINFFQKKYKIPVIGYQQEQEYAQKKMRVNLKKFSLLGKLTGPFFRFLAQLSDPRPIFFDIIMQNRERLHDLQLIALPGHTPGSAMYWHENSKSLFTGDGLLTAKPPWVKIKELTLPEEAFCCNYQQALSSLKIFSQLTFENLCPGHGPMIIGSADKLIKNFLCKQQIISK